jgi:hypothetical protein
MDRGAEVRSLRRVVTTELCEGTVTAVPGECLRTREQAQWTMDGACNSVEVGQCGAACTARAPR